MIRFVCQTYGYKRVPVAWMLTLHFNTCVCLRCCYTTTLHYSFKQLSKYTNVYTLGHTYMHKIYILGLYPMSLVPQLLPKVIQLRGWQDDYFAAVFMLMHQYIAIHSDTFQKVVHCQVDSVNSFFVISFYFLSHSFSNFIHKLMFTRMSDCFGWPKAI